jgi:hypothetical protein
MASTKRVGTVTRGTTNPNRLRRVDRFIASLPIVKSPNPVVVDLGYGASPITAIELRDRLRKVNPEVRVVGIEIEKERVARGLEIAEPGLDFLLGGFETPLPVGIEKADVIRAFNVLRQYDELDVKPAWDLMVSRLTENGVLVEGTCNEIGRLSSWITLTKDGPKLFTVSLHLSTLETPSKVAERLPKALIHHNLPGEKIHEYLKALDQAWATHAPLQTFGAMQRWLAVCETLAASGWPIVINRKRWRLGELSVNWLAVNPVD